MALLLGVLATLSLLLLALPAWAADNVLRATGGSSSDSLLNETVESRSAPVDDAAMPLGDAGAIPPQARLDDVMASFGPSSGTAVGNRAIELRDDVLRLRASVNNNAAEFMQLRGNGAAGAVQYHSTVAAITARLQNGTTRGNPILLRQWDEAEAALSEVNQSLGRLNNLATGIAADASLAAYLLESVQAAFHLSGAVDEDHDQLALLRDEVSRLVVQVDYLRNQITDDIQRQTAYLTTERSNLQSLAFAISRGELVMGGVGSRQVVVNAAPLGTAPVISLPTQTGVYPMTGNVGLVPQAAPSVPVEQQMMGVVGGPVPQSPRAYMPETSSVLPPDTGMAPNAGQLLVLVRFNQANVDYDQQLSQAISATLDRRPNAEFTVVAVSPANGETSEMARATEVASRNSENIKRSLMQMGISSARIMTASTQGTNATAPEVHVYVR
ncbi:MAG: hypothetical protein EBQ89_09355 [Alphaproteobacteria bacterium]|nr:hypothetical protein [Alphaproteobacteria bacterium]